jgi:hypothetical protein
MVYLLEQGYEVGNVLNEVSAADLNYRASTERMWTGVQVKTAYTKAETGKRVVNMTRTNDERYRPQDFDEVFVVDQEQHKLYRVPASTIIRYTRVTIEREKWQIFVVKTW